MSLLRRLCSITQTTQYFDASFVDTKALNGMSFHDSVCILEGVLLRKDQDDKKMKSALISLYSKLQMNDIVISLVSSYARNDVTRKVVKMEQAHDIRRAYKTYRKLVTEEDEDTDDDLERKWWNDGRMRCMELLQLWSTVYKNSMIDFDIECEDSVLDREVTLVEYMSRPSERTNATRFVKSSLRISSETREIIYAFSSTDDWLIRDHASAIATAYVVEVSFFFFFLSHLTLSLSPSLSLHQVCSER